jgi:hypothetical protein
MTPSVWEEADGAGLSAGINKIMGTSAGGTIEITPTEMMPAGLTTHFAWSKDSDSGNTNDKAAGGTSGILGSGFDVTVEIGSDMTGVDGLNLYAGYSEVNTTAGNGDVQEEVYGVKYAMGGFTAGWQQTKEQTGLTTTTDYENTSYSVTFSVNDDLSIGYNHTESDEVGQSKASPEADSIQAAYTMGGATMRIAEVDVSNQAYGSASYDATIVSLGLAF